MADKLVTRRDVVGWLGGAAVTMVLPALVGWVTGSFQAVASFASDQTKLLQLVCWSAAFLMSGVAIGIVVRHVVSVRQLKSAIAEKDAEIASIESEHESEMRRKDAEHEQAIAEKDAEIAKLRRNIIGLEDMDAIMRYLPDNLSRLVDEIHEEGGSVRCPHDSDLNELLSRRVIKCSSDGSGMLTWSLAPGVVKYIKEKEREDG